MQEIYPPEKRTTLPRKRILIVNCYFDDSRQPIRRTNKIPQAVGPIYLAGAFARDTCDVRCYTEVASGPLEDEVVELARYARSHRTNQRLRSNAAPHSLRS